MTTRKHVLEHNRTAAHMNSKIVTARTKAVQAQPRPNPSLERRVGYIVSLLVTESMAMVSYWERQASLGVTLHS